VSNPTEETENFQVCIISILQIEFQMALDFVGHIHSMLQVMRVTPAYICIAWHQCPYFLLLDDNDILFNIMKSDWVQSIQCIVALLALHSLSVECEHKHFWYTHICRLSHLSICLCLAVSVRLESVLWQNG